MFEQYEIATEELDILLQKKESRYLDFKSSRISGKDVQKHIVGFANADGGELYIGVEEGRAAFSVAGFRALEGANQLIQNAIIDIQPSIESLIIGLTQAPEAPAESRRFSILSHPHQRGMVGFLSSCLMYSESRLFFKA